MITDAKLMRCGGCGADVFKLFTADRQARIAADCQGCKSVSYIEPVPARLGIAWDDDSLGRLTVF
ncbi:hypothetical protein PQR66_27450 [Paraburkholderia agricolaris]|uniref:MJ0042 family finger-like domain-containing protein n=1 Tax=Paraburkholderia agricolaris TaxID=2152888 RepID=A0ABW8ZVV8_9BURK